MKAACIKCNSTKDLFKQWSNDSHWDVHICKDCIKKHKMYHPITTYSEDMDMTFIFVEARVYLSERPLGDYFVMLSQTLIGYHYGRENKECVDDTVARWIANKKNNRTELLRQAFNENYRSHEEVLY